MRPQPDAASTSTYVVRARFCDTDLMGIVHHARCLEYFQWTKRGIHLPVVEVNIRYRRSVRFDERLAIETTLSELGRATVTFTYRVLRDAPSRELVAEG